MRKSLAVALAILVLGLSVAVTSAKAAKEEEKDLVFPEANGTYDVPGNPKVKVRVFVHRPKQFAKRAPALPACTAEDPASDSVPAQAGWDIQASEWKYFVNLGSAPRAIGSANFNALTEKSFAAWNGSNVNFVNSGPTSISQAKFDGKNIVTFGTAGSGYLGVTYTMYNVQTRETLETDVVLNRRYDWTWTPYSLGNCPNPLTYDAQNILTHEIGHWIGINDEYGSEFKDSTMYGYGNRGEFKKDTPTAGDLARMNAMYQ